jgi:hypothetical protein
LHDLLRILRDHGLDGHYLFLGDYVDRGEQSVEVFLFLCALKVLFPDYVYLLRGNHERRHRTAENDFKKECNKKLDETVYSAFCDAFKWLSLAATVNGRFFCVHGGASWHLDCCEDLTTIRKPIKRVCADDVVSDILWSDPSQNSEDYRDSKRKCGYEFNQDALVVFLEHFDCETLIRAHQFCQGGFARPFGTDICITICSSAGYCGRGNSASALIVQDRIEEIVIFEPIGRENAPEMIVIGPTWTVTDDVPGSWLDPS